ncbi:DUF4214 domain-containing protein [Pseudoduganella namucuonensis]|nr:DUF4214 domain-containing protein [Pseudoduganella namucuonensis]
MSSNSAPVFSAGRSGYYADSSVGRYLMSVTELPNGKILANNGPELLRYLADGTPDTTFGSGGRLAMELGAGGYRQIYDTTPLAGGKILVTGTALNTASAIVPGDTGIVLARLNADGAYDKSFGGGKGVVYTNADPQAQATMVGAEVLPDGRILVAVDSWALDAKGTGEQYADQSIGLARYLADGTLDASFGDKGVMRDANKAFAAFHMARQADGKILVSGYERTEHLETLSVIRFNADGSRDQAFGDNGQVYSGFASQRSTTSSAQHIAVQPDGKIVVAGWGSIDNFNRRGVTVVRYNADGILDTGFSGDGQLTQVFGSQLAAPDYLNSRATNVHVNDDGTILLSGITTEFNSKANEERVIAVRLKADGSLDTSFGVQGVASTTLNSERGVYLEDMAVTADGSILLAASKGTASGSPIPTLVKLNANGELAGDFGGVSTAADNTASYREDYPEQFLNPNITVSDAQLAAAASRYAGASVTLAREGGANADDHFAAGGALAFSNGRAYLKGVEIGTAQEGGGSLRIVFNGATTQALVNAALQSITYQNTGAIVDGQQLRITWTFNDGNAAGAQGDGGALAALATTRLTLQAADTPYWIDALLQRGAGQTAAQLRAALEAALGPKHTLELAFPTGGGAFSTAEQAFIQRVVNGVGQSVDLSLADGGAPLSVHNAPELAPGESAAAALDGNGGDLYFNFGAAGAAANGAQNTAGLLHGLAHALGLRHADLPGGDAAKSSLMAGGALQALGPLDIAALQYLYGPSRTARAGDSAYSLSAGASNFIWDGAGSDTISGAGLAGDITLHLEPGHWDYIGGRGASITSAGQITVNYGSVIENATGGGGSDTLTGSAGANVLKGGAGNDSLTGLGGDDTLDGGDGLDTAVYSGLRAAYTITAVGAGYTVAGVDGTDALSGIERIKFSDSVVALNSAPAGKVTIGGKAAQHQVLTAASAVTDADGLGALSYQWYAGGVAVAGATAKSFTLTKEQVGKTMTVAVSYVDGIGTRESVTSSASGVVVRANGGPTGAVTMSGALEQNQILQASHTLGDPDGLGQVSYQWYANGKSIAGASASSLLLTEGTVGKAIHVTASYVDGQGVAESVSSAMTAAIANVNDAPAGAVAIGGQAGLAQVLSVSHTLTDADGMGAVGYQWYADGVAIAGATGASLKLDQAALGKKVTAAVSYVDGHGTPESAISAPTAVVVNDGGLAFTGGAGDDVVAGTAGSDTLDGGAGRDAAVFSGALARYAIARSEGAWLVTDSGGAGGVDTLVNIERLHFADAHVALDIDGAGGQAFRLYQAAYNRTPDGAGLGYWIGVLDAGANLRDVAAGFVASPEFQALYGAAPANRAAVNKIYANVLHREPDAAGADYWVGVLDTKAATLASVLAAFSESEENLAALVGVTGNGIVYTPFGT